MDFINRKICCNGPHCRYSRLSPIAAANVADDQGKAI